jgi:hypothetical protein
MLILSTLLKKYGFNLISVLAVFIHIAVLLLFFLIYKHNISEFILEDDDETITDEHIFYYTLVTHSTLGYGDIKPATNRGRALISTHLFLVIILLIYFGSN